MSECTLDDDSYVILDRDNMLSEDRIRTEKSLKTIFQWIALFKFNEAKTAVNQAFDSTSRQSGSTGSTNTYTPLKSSTNPYTPLKSFILDLICVEKDYVHLEIRRIRSPFAKIASFSQISSNITHIATRSYPAYNVEKLKQSITCIIRDVSNSRVQDDATALVRAVASDLEIYINARFIKLHDGIIANQIDAKSTAFYRHSLEKLVNIKTETENIKSETLIPLKDMLIYETSAVEHLFSCYLSLAQWEFVDSLLHLQNFAQIYHEFIDKYSDREKSLTGKKGTKGDEFPELHKWFYKVYEVLLAKYTLYFSKTLFSDGKKPTRGSLTNVIDFSSRIVEFSKKTKSHSTSLILYTKGLDKQFLGHGYKIRPGDLMSEGGVEERTQLSDSVISQFTDHFEIIFYHGKEEELDDRDFNSFAYMFNDTVLSEKAKPFIVDSERNKSYFISPIDENIFLAVVYNNRKNESDSEIKRFLDDFNHSMKLNKLD